MTHAFHQIVSGALLCVVQGLSPVSASPVKTVDLASDTAWTLSIDGDPARPVKVPGGGWNSDFQSPRIPTMQGVDDHVMYRRTINVPKVMENQVTKILFGAVNYGAEVYIDDKLAATVATPCVPFEVDISGFVKPGGKHRLGVKAYHRRHYNIAKGNREYCTLPVGFDFPKDSEKWCRWAGNTKFAYGITTSIRLAVYPPVFIDDVFVQPSVSKAALKATVWVHNSTDKTVEVEVSGKLSSCNHAAFRYPEIPEATCAVGPHATAKVSLGPVHWGLGKDSYWWPNIPFDENYKATLHYLDIDATRKGRVVDSFRQRFGFVEHAEGPYYYTVNGVRVSGFGDSASYGQVGEFDCWSTTPCFLPPTGKYKGCPETWKRYQRIGFNSMRTSTSLPTPCMLDAADEAGFMLIPEGGSWGNNLSLFNRKTFSAQLRGVIRACRNHPSVARYSLCNEPREKRDENWPWRGIVDDAYAADPTRPLVMEVHKQGFGRVDGFKSPGHAFIMEHYARITKADGKTIRGMGECCWGTDRMAEFAFTARQLRLNDWAYFAPWSWINYWPNFLEGMNHERHPWKVNDHPDRTDNLDGWNSPIVEFVRKSLHPYLLVDHEIHRKQPPPGKKLEDASFVWPGDVPEYAEGSRIARKIEVFNGGLSGGRMSLRWSAHWNSPSGPVADKDAIGPFEVKPGFHATQTVSFTAPDPARENQRLYLVLESVKEGKVVFVEDAVFFTITHAPSP